MIDTVALAYNLIVDTEHPVLWDLVDKHLAIGKRILRYQLNVQLENGATVTGTYRLYIIGGGPQLRVEFSIPKLIYGNNYILVNDIEEAIPSINQALAGIEGLPSIDARQGIVRRTDACYNHQVGAAVPYYIRAFRSLEFPYRRMRPYTGEGVQLENKQATTKFYDKEKECAGPLAYGILRQETTLRRDAVKKMTGAKRPVLSNLTPQFLTHVLEQDLDKLGILGRSIGIKDTTLQVLSKEYGELAGIFYYGLLHARTNLTPEMVASASGSHPSSLNRRLQKIAQAGIRLTLSETLEPLPPLTIDLNFAIAQTAHMLAKRNRQ
jgi:hypothetical protein